MCACACVCVCWGGGGGGGGVGECVMHVNACMCICACCSKLMQNCSIFDAKTVLYSTNKLFCNSRKTVL